MSVREIIYSTGKYLLLQRTYSELDFGEDNYYFETHDADLAGEFESFEIEMSRQIFKLEFDFETIKVSINPTDSEFADLKRVIAKIVNKRGRLTINK